MAPETRLTRAVRWVLTVAGEDMKMSHPETGAYNSAVFILSLLAFFTILFLFCVVPFLYKEGFVLLALFPIFTVMFPFCLMFFTMFVDPGVIPPRVISPEEEEFFPSSSSSSNFPPTSCFPASRLSGLSDGSSLDAKGTRFFEKSEPGEMAIIPRRSCIASEQGAKLADHAAIGRGRGYVETSVHNSTEMNIEGPGRIESSTTEFSVRSPQQNAPAHMWKKSIYVRVSNTAFGELRLCETCHIYRPPRAAHCHICGYCFMRFDHHCSTVGNCIGKRNLHYFVGFVFTTACNCFIATYMGYVQLFTILARPEYFADMPTNFPEEELPVDAQWMDTLLKSIRSWPPYNAIPAIVSIFTLAVIGLNLLVFSMYYVYLAARNQTTRESVKNAQKHENPYSKGIIYNLCSVLCPPRKISFVSNLSAKHAMFTV